MKITQEMMTKILSSYQKGDNSRHFELPEGKEAFIEKAKKTFAKDLKGNILAILDSTMIQNEFVVRGYIVTDLFIYGDDMSPIYIHDIKDAYDKEGTISIDYFNGGKRNYEGGAFYSEIFNLIYAMKQKISDPYPTDLNELMKIAILTYNDDGGYEFKLVEEDDSRIQKYEDPIVGILDSSLLQNGKNSILVSAKYVYSEYFESHRQKPIDILNIAKIEVKGNRLISEYKDGTKQANYVSVYGNDLMNLLNLYLFMVK